MERKNAWAAYAEDDSRVEAFAKAYCDFINNGKTERECVAYGEKLAKAHGFEDLNAVIRSGRKLPVNIPEAVTSTPRAST